MAPLRLICLLRVLVSLSATAAWADEATAPSGSATLSILKTGAIGDGATLDTTSIQKGIDQLAKESGGTWSFPPENS